MEINGSQSIGAPRQKVWDALNDPVVLKQCLPGCESVERVSPVEFRVVMAAAIGPLRARFNGKLNMTESRPPESCTMVFEGQGGVVGFGKGSSSVALVETAEGTTLNYTANAQVGGKLAQVGSRLIDNVARKMADDFFTALRRQLVPGSDAGTAKGGANAAAAAAPPAAGTAGARIGNTAGAAAAARQPATDKAGAASAAGHASAPTSTSTSSPTQRAQPGMTEPQAAAAIPALSTAAPSAPAQHLASPPAAAGQQPPLTAMVPAWWLAVAMVLGAAASLAGVVLGR